MTNVLIHKMKIITGSPTQYLCPWETPENCLTLKWSQVTTGCTVELDWHHLCPLGVCTGTTGSHGSAAASAENSAFISYNTYKTLVLSVGWLRQGFKNKKNKISGIFH